MCLWKTIYLGCSTIRGGRHPLGVLERIPCELREDHNSAEAEKSQLASCKGDELIPMQGQLN